MVAGTRPSIYGALNATSPLVPAALLKLLRLSALTPSNAPENGARSPQPSRVASATSIYLYAAHRFPNHSKPGKRSVSLETHERLSIPSGTPNRSLNRYGFLKPTIDNPVRACTHTKNPATCVKKRKGNRHSTEEQSKQRIIMQRPSLLLSELKSRK